MVAGRVAGAVVSGAGPVWHHSTPCTLHWGRCPGALLDNGLLYSTVSTKVFR